MEGPVCKHNQSGYCKHGTLCHKRHENEICPKNNICNDMSCEMRHPKRCKYFEINNRCKFENCAYAHNKDENQAKIEALETKCSKLENEVKDLKEEQEKFNPRIDLMGKGLMKLKREVERLTSLCNGKNSTIETVVNENKMVEKNKSPNIIEEKIKINSKDKNIPKTQYKKKEKSEEQSGKEIETKKYICNECDDVFEKETGLECHMLKKHEAENDLKCDEDFIKCDHCSYKCKKSIDIRKHMNSKHREYTCNYCNEKFKSENELQKHESENHDKKEVKKSDIKVQQCESPVVCELIGCCWCKYQG